MKKLIKPGKPIVSMISDLLNFAESQGGIAEFRDAKGQLWMIRKKVIKHDKKEK